MARMSAGLAAITLILAACNGSDSSSPEAGTPLTMADAQAISNEMQGELAGITSGASVQDFLAPPLTALPGADRAFHGPIFFNPLSNCPIPSENPPTDTDGDGVPDNLTLSFEPPAECTFTSPRGNAVLELSGNVTISDPSAVDRGIRIEFQDFQKKTTVNETTFFLRRVDGVLQQISSATGFSATDNTTVTWESSQFPTAELAKAWQVDFVADAGATFSHRFHLPSGILTVVGKTTRTHGGLIRSLSVETTDPLHFDASCAADNRIVSGTLTIVHTGPSGTSTITIVFNGCGQDPTVTLVTGPTAS